MSATYNRGPQPVPWKGDIARWLSTTIDWEKKDVLKVEPVEKTMKQLLVEAAYTAGHVDDPQVIGTVDGIPIKWWEPPTEIVSWMDTIRMHLSNACLHGEADGLKRAETVVEEAPPTAPTPVPEIKATTPDRLSDSSGFYGTAGTEVRYPANEMMMDYSLQTVAVHLQTELDRGIGTELWESHTQDTRVRKIPHRYLVKGQS